VGLHDYVSVVREQGTQARLRGVMVDITERKRAEEALRQSEARFRRIVDSNMIGVCFWDIRGGISEANDLFLSIVGGARADLVTGRLKWRDITPPELRPQVEGVLRAMSNLGACAPFATEFLKADGGRVPVVMGAAYLDDSRERGVSFVLDMTERKRAEERQAFMMAELNHRVKNNLAAVLTLAEQSIKPAQTGAEIGESLLGRLRALARMHNALAQTHWHGAHLTPLVQQTVEAFRQGASSAVSISGDDVVLPARTASALAMAIHELATNAMKYGSLSRPEGRVAVEWTTVTEAGRPMLRLTWTESGGPPVATPTRRGFGRELIEGGVAYEALGRVRLLFPSEGVRCEMVVSLGPEDPGHGAGPGVPCT
jgi:PAS domain S-box-containing protein